MNAFFPSQWWEQQSSNRKISSIDADTLSHTDDSCSSSDCSSDPPGYDADIDYEAPPATPVAANGVNASSSRYMEMTNNYSATTTAPNKPKHNLQLPPLGTAAAAGANATTTITTRTQEYTSKLMGMMGRTPLAVGIDLERGGSRLSIGSMD